MKPSRIIIPIIVLMVVGIAQAGGDHTDRAFNFGARLSGAHEVPPVDTATKGKLLLHIDRHLTHIWFGLVVRRGEAIFGAAGAHLHCAPKGENGPIIAFLAGMSTPGFDGRLQNRATLSDASILETDCGTNIAEVVEAMLDGMVYVNVHSTANPAGEVRGQLHGPSDKPHD